MRPSLNPWKLYSQPHGLRRTWFEPALGDAAQLPTRSAEIEVSYEGVAHQGSNTYKLLGPSAQPYVQDVTATAKEVDLANLNTYADALSPLITVTIATDQAPAVGTGPGYEVWCEIIVDGQVASRTTYKAGPTSPLFVTQ